MWCRLGDEDEEEEEEEEGDSLVIIIPPVPKKIRWFALSMIVVFLKIQKAAKLHAIVSEKMVPISATDWKNARGFFDILQPFVHATNIQ